MYYLTRTDGTKEYIQPYTWNADPQQIRPAGHWISTREKYGKREHWWSEPIFVDTETSHIGENEGWVHQWAAEWGGKYIKGRTAGELCFFLDHVSALARHKGKNRRIMVYIHNMGYDMEYLRCFFPNEEPEFFAVKPHRILTARWKQLEMRCSYMLTNKPLKKWAKDSKADYQKLTGVYDYDRIITPEDPLKPLDWAYQFNDVAAQSSAWHKDRLNDGYDVTTIPMTSTGFVRADCRQASQANPYWSMQLKGMQPDVKIYNAEEQAFSGGETHGNRFFKDQTVNGPIGHRDFCSSYPARQMMNGFPMGAFHPEKVRCTQDVQMLMRNNCLLIHLVIKNIELRDRAITAPYLSISKCHFPNGKVKDYLDNGRVIRLEGVAELWLTELDYMILMKQYAFFDSPEGKGGYHITESYIAPKGKLPKWFRDKIMKYFKNKCTLKHSDFATYMGSKAKLNGIYGMTAEKFVREILTYSAGEWNVRSPDDDERTAAYNKKVSNKNTFLPFAWGVWTTAWARWALNQCIELVGWENFLYCDTDSIFYLSSPEIEARFDDYNAMIRRKAEAAGAVVEWEGKKYTLGEFTMEDDAPIQKFRFIHAKCYAVIDCNGELKVTVAGVTHNWRSDGGKTSADELGCIDNLTEGFVFRECGGTRITYNNKPLHIIKYNGVEICCGSSAVISPTEYEVNDLNELDSDDDLMLALINPALVSDLYGNFAEVK